MQRSQCHRWTLGLEPWRETFRSPPWAVALVILVLAGGIAPGAEDQTVTPAARAWEAVLEAEIPPAPPDRWFRDPPSPKEMRRFALENARQAGRAADKARAFYRRYPKHEKASEARLREFIALSVAVEFGAEDRVGELVAARATLTNNPRLSEADRFRLRSGPAQWMVDLLNYKYNPVNLDQLERKIRELQREFPERAEPGEFLLVLLQNRLYYGQYGPARALAEELAASEGEHRAPAQGVLRKLERLGKPLSLKFTAVDGREVDLGHLRGRVVLIDFWATWCPPCMRELGHLRALYQRFHPRGFEIVGISADDDKAALLEVIQQFKLPWPQHFDGRGEENRWIQEFEALPLPAMWLIDRRGRLRDLSGQMELEQKIERLLGETADSAPSAPPVPK